MKPTFEIKELAPLNVIACRHIGDYSKICPAFEKLAIWAGQKGLMGPDVLMAAIYHDAPCSKPIDQLRSDACIVVDTQVAGEGEFVQYTIAGGKFAVGHFELAMDEFGSAWKQIYEYLSEKGYQCGDGDHHELYLNDAKDHPEGKWIVDICVPIK